MSKSYPEDLSSYLTSRLLTIPILVLLLLLLLAAWLPSPPRHAFHAGIQILITINLLAMFRLWDDLSDLADDRLAKPDRILCQTTHLVLFRWTCFLLGMTALIMLALTIPNRVLGLLLLIMVFGIYYRQPWRSSWPRLAYHLLIAKYPCFVALISMPQEHNTRQLQLMLMLVAYLFLCIYEVLHDPKLRTDAWCRRIAATELVAATIAASWIMNELFQSPTP